MRKYESPSSCYMYDNCPRKYKFRYIEKIPEKSNRYADFGLSFEKEVCMRWENRNNFYHKNKDTEKMLKVLFQDEYIKKMPQAQIYQYKIDVPCGNGRLVGYPDIVHTDDSISDIKTSKTRWNEDRFTSTEQHLAYVYGCKKSRIIKKNFPILFRFIIITTQKTPQLQIKEILVTKEDIEKYISNFNNRKIRISLDQFQPKKSYQCNWCSYKNICPAWV